MYPSCVVGDTKIVVPLAGIIDLDKEKERQDKKIEKLNKEGMTIIMISHDVEAVKYATHVLDFGDNISFMTRENYEARKAVL